MKKATICLLIFFLLLGLRAFTFGPAAFGAGSAYKTYNGKAFHFRVQVPVNWTIGRKPSFSFDLVHYPEVAAFSSPRLHDAGAEVRITADVAYPAPGMRDLAFLIEAKARLLEGYRELEAVRTLRDRVYFRYSYINQHGKEVFCTRALLLRAEQPNLFDITCLASSKADDRMAREDFLRIIKSFFFITQPSDKAGGAPASGRMN
jgi:hypothetical protein